jgi:hypothetical protein
VGPQIAKGTLSTAFYRFRVLAARGGLVTETEPMPPEISGVPITDGAHSLGAYHASIVDMIPRIEGDLGWLLFALCGAVSTISDIPEAGMYTHIFRMDSTDYLALKWLSLRRLIPGPEGGADSGEIVKDARLSGAVFNFNAAARLTAQLSFYGREPTFSDSVGGWSWEDTAESGDSVMIPSTTSAYFKIPTFQAGNLPVNGAAVTIGNQVTRPQEEYIIGSPYPEDIVGLYRNVSIQAAYKWEDEDLYLQLVAAGGTGASIAWDPTIYTSTFRILEVSPNDVSGMSNPYSFEIRAEKVYWFPSAGPEIAGLNIIRLPLTGLVARPSSGDPFQVRIVNEVASYTWPT